MIKLLRAEGFLILVVALLVYFHLHIAWYWLLLILLPDVTMAGYLKDSKLGSIIYNLGHTYVFPLLLLIITIVFPSTDKILNTITLIWVAHIGMDRAFGYGLKHSSGFRDTHLGRIGK